MPFCRSILQKYRAEFRKLFILDSDRKQLGEILDPAESTLPPEESTYAYIVKHAQAADQQTYADRYEWVRKRYPWIVTDEWAARIGYGSSINSAEDVDKFVDWGRKQFPV